MEYVITDLTKYDTKRLKVTLNDGEMTFLLYDGEVKRYIPIGENGLSSAKLDEIIKEVLIPRAKKRALYLLKNSDKTEFQIRKKLGEACTDENIIEEVMRYLKKNGLIDDLSYATRYAGELKKDHSRLQIVQKLMSRGIDKETISMAVSELSGEDEIAACKNVLRRRLSCKDLFEKKDEPLSKDAESTILFLKRKGFAHDTISQCLGDCC